MAGQGADGRFGPIRRVAYVVVPIGMAVVSWFALLIAVGAVARAESLSLSLVLSVALAVGLFWPVYLFAPWRAGVSDRLIDWAVESRADLLAATLLGVVTVVPFVPGAIHGLLTLPFRSAGFLFPVSIFYREQFGFAFGQAFLRFGQFYLEGLWLYLLGSGGVALAGRFS